MQMLDAERQMITDLKDEGRIMQQRQFEAFLVTTVRHPTLGKLVLVEGTDGAGVVVELED